MLKSHLIELLRGIRQGVHLNVHRFETSQVFQLLVNLLGVGDDFLEGVNMKKFLQFCQNKPGELKAKLTFLFSQLTLPKFLPIHQFERVSLVQEVTPFFS